MRLLLAGVLSLFTQCAEAATPIWDAHPTLVCRYDRVQFCLNDMSSCQAREGRAVLTFDFRKNEVRSFSSERPFPIAGRYHFGSGTGDINTVLADGNMYSFGADIKSGIEPVTIEGIAQSAMGLGATSAFNAHMTCHPT